MKTLDNQANRPEILRMIPSPLVHLFGDQSSAQNDPPAVRAAWLRLYFEIVRKPRRNPRKH
jgi:hypothetical protein